MRRIASFAPALGLLVLAPRLQGQSISETNLRSGPQFVQYTMKSPIDVKVSELAVPIFVVVPVTSALTIDVGTAFASAKVEGTASSSAGTSSVSGLTDTQIRANYTVGTDFIVLTAGLNVPTGREFVKTDEQLAAFLIANDFLSFPISNMGTGLGGTGGIALARPIGEWNLGVGASVRASGAYEPLEGAVGGGRLRFQPGAEYRGRLGADRSLGTGRFSFGVTYSKFGDDQLDTSVYNTGDRIIAQGGLTNSIGSASLTLNAWDLYRASGSTFVDTTHRSENIANLLVAVGFRTAGGVVEPSVEVRSWARKESSSSMLTTFAIRYTYETAGFAITPSAGYSTGNVGSNGPSASLSGFRGALAIRLGP